MKYAQNLLPFFGEKYRKKESSIFREKLKMFNHKKLKK